jgi:hypothetical protein
MDLITAADVIRAVELYYRGGALRYLPVLPDEASGREAA